MFKKVFVIPFFLKIVFVRHYSDFPRVSVIETAAFFCFLYLLLQLKLFKLLLGIRDSGGIFFRGVGYT